GREAMSQVIRARNLVEPRHAGTPPPAVVAPDLPRRLVPRLGIVIDEDQPSGGRAPDREPVLAEVLRERGRVAVRVNGVLTWSPSRCRRGWPRAERGSCSPARRRAGAPGTRRDGSPSMRAA